MHGTPAPPRGGNAAALAAAFAVPGQAVAVEQVLRTPSGQGGYVFEYKRHAELVRLLDLPDIGVATGFHYIEAGEFPDGLHESDLRQVG
jgi:hypothetical protein